MGFRVPGELRKDPQEGRLYGWLIMEIAKPNRVLVVRIRGVSLESVAPANKPPPESSAPDLDLIGGDTVGLRSHQHLS